MIKNYLSHFLPVLLALDLIIPFLLAPFYKDYNHLTQVMSVLGNSKAPLHSIYNIWLVAFGVAILISTLQLYPTVAQVSSSISIMLFSVIVIYAVGGCILSGIFSVGETKSLETLSAKIHIQTLCLRYSSRCLQKFLMGNLFTGILLQQIDVKQRFNTFRPKEFIAAYTMLYSAPLTAFHAICCGTAAGCSLGIF